MWWWRPHLIFNNLLRNTAEVLTFECDLRCRLIRRVACCRCWQQQQRHTPHQARLLIRQRFPKRFQAKVYCRRRARRKVAQRQRTSNTSGRGWRSKQKQQQLSSKSKLFARKNIVLFDPSIKKQQILSSSKHGVFSPHPLLWSGRFL